jgi:hypothetical protein
MDPVEFAQRTSPSPFLRMAFHFVSTLGFHPRILAFLTTPEVRSFLKCKCPNYAIHKSTACYARLAAIFHKEGIT